MPQEVEMQEIPLHQARAAVDLLPPEQYPGKLPEREKRPSRFSNFIHNRKFHIALGVLAGLGILGGAAALGIRLGQRQHHSTATQATVTPTMVTVQATQTIDVTSTTTMQSVTPSTLVTVTTCNMGDPNGHLCFNSPQMQSATPTTFVTETTCQMGGEHHTKGEGPQYTVDGVYWECLGPSRLSQMSEFEATRIRPTSTIS